MGRADDVINVLGHRLSTGAIEAAVGAHGAVAECAVVGVPDSLKGQVPIACVVLREGAELEPAQLEAEVRDLVRAEVGPIAVLKTVAIIAALPKSRSGKVVESDHEGHRPGP